MTPRVSLSRVKPPPHYEPPSDATIREAAQARGLRAYSPSFIRDLCSYWEGGRFVPEDELEQAAFRAYLAALQPDRRGKYPLPGGSLTRDKQVAVEAWTERRLRYEQDVRLFIESLDPPPPGTSNLEHAVHILAVLQDLELVEGVDGEPLPVFSRQSPQEVAEELRDYFDDLEVIEEDPILEALLGDLPRFRRKASEVDAVFLHRIARKLDEYAAFRTRVLPHLVPDREGDEVRRRRLRKYGELPRAGKRLWAQPRRYRNYLLARKQVLVRERVRRDARKQLVGVLVDCSGSMDRGSRIHLALGVLLNRLEAAARGQAEVWFQFFDDRLRGPLRHAHDLPSARECLEIASENNYNGGDTAIQACTIRFAELLAEKDGRRPEIIVVTDGDDRVDSEALAARVRELGFTLHAFIVERSNADLAQAARATGGLALDRFRLGD